MNAVGLENANGFGIQAWASAMLFKQVVDGIVAQDGINALTRERFLDAIAQVSRLRRRRDDGRRCTPATDG